MIKRKRTSKSPENREKRSKTVTTSEPQESEDYNSPVPDTTGWHGDEIEIPERSQEEETLGIVHDKEPITMIAREPITTILQNELGGRRR